MVGIEVKWGGGIKDKDLNGLNGARETLGKRWRFGVLIYGGNETVAIDEKTLAVPFGVFFGMER